MPLFERIPLLASAPELLDSAKFGENQSCESSLGSNLAPYSKNTTVDVVVVLDYYPKTKFLGYE